MPGPLRVEPVSSWWQQRTFLNLPWTIQGRDPNWMCPLRQTQKELVGYAHHPFYNDAKVCTFLATRDGQAVGRIAAIVNHGHNRRYAEKRGFFGFFDCRDDQEAAHGLFDAACDWLRKEGMNAVRGPANPSLNYECGLLVEGFDTPPYFMMTHNPLYYAKLLESYGFEKTQDLYAYTANVELLKTYDRKIDFIIQEVKSRFNLNMREMDKKRFMPEVRLFLDIYNQSLDQTWGFVPLTEGELEHAAGGLKHLIIPELTSLAEVDGKPIGASFALLDYNPLIKKIDGRLFPFGFFRLMWNRRKIQRTRLVSTNVLPEFQMWGVGVVITTEMVPKGVKWGLKEVEASWILESNPLSWKSLARAGFTRTKTYRLYDYNLNPAPEVLSAPGEQSAPSE